MTGKSPPKDRNATAESREARLKAALKANLARRKAQARARAVDAGGVADNEKPDSEKKD